MALARELVEGSGAHADGEWLDAGELFSAAVCPEVVHVRRVGIGRGGASRHDRVEGEGDSDDCRGHGDGGQDRSDERGFKAVGDRDGQNEKRNPGLNGRFDRGVCSARSEDEFDEIADRHREYEDDEHRPPGFGEVWLAGDQNSSDDHQYGAENSSENGDNDQQKEETDHSLVSEPLRMNGPRMVLVASELGPGRISVPSSTSLVRPVFGFKTGSLVAVW